MLIATSGARPDTVGHAADAPIALVDTSVAIALCVEDHQGHVGTRRALRGRQLGLAGQAWFETFSVLTRLPPGQRQSPAGAARLLSHNFPHSRFLTAEHAAGLAADLAQLSIGGGVVYDALVAMTAVAHGMVLVSRDARAKRTYEAMGASVELLAD
jgi:predicted nucleic acid-binding protein